MTIPGSRPVTDESSLLSHYERLRSHVLSGCVAGVRTGLGVMLHKGMAAWMEACSSCGKPSDRPAALPHCTKVERIMPDEQFAEFVELFTGMALNRLKGVYA